MWTAIVMVLLVFVAFKYGKYEERKQRGELEEVIFRHLRELNDKDVS